MAFRATGATMRKQPASAADKENMRPATGPASRGRPLSANAANVPASRIADKKPAVATPRATPRTGGVARPKAGAAPKVAAAPRVRLTPAQRILKEAGELEEKVLSMEEELALLEIQASEGEAKAEEAEEAMLAGEQELTDTNAAQLVEYTEKQEKIDAQEDQLKELQGNLEANCARNVALNKRNLVLDRETRERQQKLTEAEADYKRLNQSQDDLKAELDRQAKNCQRVKLAAKAQAEQCAVDVEKIGGLRDRLMEVCAGAPSEVVMRLLEDSKVRMAKVKKDQVWCENLYHEGLQVDDDDDVEQQPSSSSRRLSAGGDYEMI